MIPRTRDKLSALLGNTPRVVAGLMRKIQENNINPITIIEDITVMQI